MDVFWLRRLLFSILFLVVQILFGLFLLQTFY